MCSKCLDEAIKDLDKLEQALEERDEKLQQVRIERDQANAALKIALIERDSAAEAAQSLSLRERHALEERDQALAERDQARKELEQANAALKLAADVHARLAAERDEALANNARLPASEPGESPLRNAMAKNTDNCDRSRRTLPFRLERLIWFAPRDQKQALEQRFAEEYFGAEPKNRPDVINRLVAEHSGICSQHG